MTGLARFLAGTTLLIGGLSLKDAVFAEEAPATISARELPVGISMEGDPRPQFGPPPRVAILREELEAAKDSPRFPALKADAIAKAAPFLEDPVTLPDGPGGWIFDYANPATGTRLRPRSSGEHEDPKTGEIFTDARTQAAYRTTLHYRAEKAALAFGWAWAWSGEEQYASEVRRILLKLAHDYSGYPTRLDRWGRVGYFARWGGRRYAQALDEATGIIPLAKAYDLTRTSDVYSDDDHHLIQTRFFRPTADTLLRFNQGKVNHQTWYNAGLMAIAGVLEDGRLARRVVTMRGGYLDQLRTAVGHDGLWWEGTLAYHRYAMSAMMALVETAERYGLPLGKEPRLRSMFTAPLPLAFPNGQLPAINDSDPIGLAAFQSGWEWAARQWDDPLFHRLARDPSDRPEPHTQALPDAGLAILRRGEGEDASAAYLDYGPHGGSHGHFDKLNLILYANRHEWLPDPGRLTYSQAEHKTWAKTTAAHNTVVINERNQRPASGKLLYLKTAADYAAAGAESRTAYERTILRRHLVLTDDFLADLYEVIAPRRSTIDLITHARADRLHSTRGGHVADSLPVRLGTRDGYEHLRPAISYAPWPFSPWTFEHGSLQLVAHLLPDEDERLITTAGIGYTLKEKTPTLIRRRSARTTTFVTVYDLSGSGTGVREIRRPDGNSSGVEITTATGIWHIDPVGSDLRVDLKKLPPTPAK